MKITSETKIKPISAKNPILFSGTLRFNLDPMDECVDADIWRCLDSAHLKHFVQTAEDNLAFEVAEGGQNLTWEQRRLVAVARSALCFEFIAR